MAQDTVTEPREFATRYTAAWCSQDAASVAAFFAPGGSLNIMEAPRRWDEARSPKLRRGS